MRLKGICKILRLVFLVGLFALGFSSLILGAAIHFRSQPLWTRWGLYCSGVRGNVYCSYGYCTRCGRGGEHAPECEADVSCDGAKLSFDHKLDLGIFHCGAYRGCENRTLFIEYASWFPPVVLFPLPVIALLRGPVRRRRRRRRGQCVPCGYDLTGNTSGRCPECGAKLDGVGRGNPALLKGEG